MLPVRKDICEQAGAQAKSLLFFGLVEWAWEGVGRVANFQIFQICRSPVTMATSGVKGNIPSKEINTSTK